MSGYHDGFEKYCISTWFLGCIEREIDTNVQHEKKRLLERIENQICFDAKADPDGRCEHHGGKCYELGLLIKGETK